MNQKIQKRLDRAIQEKVFPGCVVGIVDREGRREVYPCGNCTYEPGAPKVTEQTIYDVASITKAIPGACSLLKLIDEGKVNLEDRVSNFIPEFGTDHEKKKVTIDHVLRYLLELDIAPLSTLKNKTPNEIIEAVLKAPLKSPAGSTYRYGNSTAVIISLLIEKISGERLDVFADTTFFKPLGMKRTTFHPNIFPKQEIAPTEIDAWRGRVIQGEVHDESTFTLQQKYLPAIAGLFSTVPDLLIFAEMLLGQGELHGQRYFSKQIIEAMETGLGWELDDTIYFKTGFTGCLIALHSKKGRAFVMLSNRTFPHRPPTTEAIKAVRDDMSEIIFM
jgi:CubicO group peptidase (beta-lactamase class C family)